MEKKKFKFGLIPRILVAIILGFLLGKVFPEWAVKGFSTFNSIFGNFLQFLIPLIIVGLVTPAIAEVGSGAGKLLLITVLISYLDTVFFGTMSYLVSAGTFPQIISRISSGDFGAVELSVVPYFTINMPPFMDVVSALILSFILGLGIAALKTDALANVFEEFKTIVTKVIEKVVIPLLPLYIFGIFLMMSFTGSANQILKVFMGIIVVIFIMHILVLIIQYCAAGAVVKRNPFKLLGNMLPAYFTALGTSSSAATIPVTLKCTEKNGVSKGIAGFTIPLCATIHMAGSVLKIVACAVAIILMKGMDISFGTMMGFICMLGVMLVAAPGVPGGSIMASLGILSSILGFGPDEQALMIALYIVMDNFGTACNVTGDGAISLVVNKIFAKDQETGGE